MPLEDLTGTKFITDLTETWPLGSDLPSAGDDHLRGIKNVLKRQFPNLGQAAVTATAEELNRGSVPVGSYTIFIQAIAPVGWMRYPSATFTTMLRIVPIGFPSSGGTVGGIDDPIFNDKVAEHDHGISLSTTFESAEHTHHVFLYTSIEGEHSHTIGDYAVKLSPSNKFNYGTTLPIHDLGSASTSIAPSHYHVIDGNTSTESAYHYHSIAGNTSGVAGPTNWRPRYHDCILCVRES